MVGKVSRRSIDSRSASLNKACSRAAFLRKIARFSARNRTPVGFWENFARCRKFVVCFIYVSVFRGGKADRESIRRNIDDGINLSGAARKMSICRNDENVNREQRVHETLDWHY